MEGTPPHVCCELRSLCSEAVRLEFFVSFRGIYLLKGFSWRHRSINPPSSIDDYLALQTVLAMLHSSASSSPASPASSSSTSSSSSSSTLSPRFRREDLGIDRPPRPIELMGIVVTPADGYPEPSVSATRKIVVLATATDISLFFLGLLLARPWFSLKHSYLVLCVSLPKISFSFLYPFRIVNSCLGSLWLRHSRI